MLSERIKELRHKKGVSQLGLAQHIGFSQQAVAKWETDRATPSPETLAKMAEFFNVSVDFLIGTTDNPIPPSKKKSPSEIQMSDVSYALFGEVRELTEEDKEELLRAARRMRELRELKEQNKRSQDGI